LSSPKLLAFAAAVLFARPCLAEAPPLNSKTDARALTETVMQLVVADKISDAMDKLKAYWRLPPNEIDTLVLKTISLRNTIADRYGRTLSYAFVREEDVGDYLVRYTYVERRENHPLRWTFIFYRATDRWWMDSASWDDKVSELFAP